MNHYEYKLPKREWVRIHPDWLERVIVDLCGGGHTQAQTLKAIATLGQLSRGESVTTRKFKIRRVR